MSEKVNGQTPATGKRAAEEIYDILRERILSGELTLEENGVVSILKEGDVSVCRDGNGHSIKNHTDKEAKMLALIVEK